MATTVAIVFALVRETINFFEMIPFTEYAFGDRVGPARSSDAVTACCR